MARVGSSDSAAGLSAIALALLFNAPYAVLAATYDYPDILRRPASEALARFAEGGAALILTWHAFALCALALAPVAVALTITRERLENRPALAVGAAALGALAGVVQAIGLWRWVFVTPALARVHSDPASSAEARAAAERAFELLNLYGGVAIGEHLGQWLTALFVGALARLQWGEGAQITGVLGGLTALVLAIGTTEGLAVAMGRNGDVFAMATIVGFLLLTVWLIASGLQRLRNQEERAPSMK